MTFLIVMVLAAASGAATPAQEQAPGDQHEHHQPAPPAAQEQGDQQHPPPAEQPPGEHVHHGGSAMTMFSNREASGTAWLPDTTPMYGLYGEKGSWQLMGHGNAFVQFLYDRGDRGSDQLGSINWVMGMARRPLAGGRLGLRGMLSLEPWTIGACGYPDLLATGEVCEGRAIHDRQHPHDLLMELAAEYDGPLRGAARWQIYGGLAGEPALGPVAYPHRVSALPNPLAPISHHWLDATHITFGVVTAGVYGTRWKAEASTFNGREPGEDRADLDFGALDSFSGRIWFVPTPNLALQLSAGHLDQAEVAPALGRRVDVDRVTGSATYHRWIADGSVWASTLAWGMNTELEHSTHALLVEASLTLRERDAWFGRLEFVAKPAHDLDIGGSDEAFTVAKLQMGYTRYLETWHGLKPGIGGGISMGIVPGSIGPAYGGRVNPGFAVFVTVRPAAHRME